MENKKKLLSVAIPCYNSEAYMSHAIETLLVGEELVEIIVVNDGSSDGTEKIAQQYAEKYPTMIKVVSQENGGHGEAVNTGLHYATGEYFKVVDSDDWLDEASLKRVLKRLKYMVEHDNEVDMFLCNYVYERVHEEKQIPMDYKSVFPVDQVFTWDDIKHFKQSQYILMHSVIYRTQILRDCGLRLPKHTFYVDNIYVYTPLPYVKTMYYMNVNLYRYFIGREDQSVNEKVMIGRIDQQLFVTKRMIKSHSIMEIEDKKLQAYMVKYITMMMTISTVFLMMSEDAKKEEKRTEIWNYLKKKDYVLYKKVKNTALGRSMQMNGKVGNKIILSVYRTCQKIFGFN